MSVGLGTRKPAIPLATCFVFFGVAAAVPAKWMAMKRANKTPKNHWFDFTQDHIAIYTGRMRAKDAIVQILIGAIYSADHQLTITTPYLVPDDSLQRALISAARRGVDVTIVIPKQVDSRLVRLASRAAIRELIDSGIRVAYYRKGMLHTKSISIDGEISFFGSLNLDPRSLQLNFELMLVLYGKLITQDLMNLQAEYISNSDLCVADEQQLPSLPIRFLESCARLVSPLL